MIHQLLLLLLTLTATSDAALSEIIPFQLAMAVPGPGSVFVSGQLMCHGKPYANETVQIFEKNYVFSDNKFAETVTDSDGRFEMKAWIEEYWPLIVTPYVYIPNYCDSVMNDDEKRCSSSGVQINFDFRMITRSEGAPLKKLIVGPLELSGEPASERLGIGSWFGGWLASEKICRDY